MKISRKLFIPLLFIGWMVVLTVFSLLPQGGVALREKWDKIAHFAAYFITALLFYRAFRTRLMRADIYAVLFAFCYGALLELVQWVVPHRVGSFKDLAANFFGVLFFFVLYRVLWGRYA
jgi:VanZ family protein